MSITIRAQLDEADYVAAQRLGRRPSRWWGIVAFAFGLLLTLVAIESAKANNSLGFTLSLAALVGGIIGGLAGHYFWVPWWARRVFRQQKSLQRAFELSWDDSGIHARDDNGEYKHLWSDFIRWREGERLFVLNLSDAMFLMIPKRAFLEEQNLNAFREQVRSHVGS